MALNFELILVLATAVAGLVWLVDACFFARRRASAAGGGRRKSSDPLLVEYARSFFPVLLIVLVLRSFVAEPFRIPSESMLPTLEVGDFILVSKYSYDIRLPVTQSRIVETNSPERGDVAVFRYPVDPSINYIKRIVGLPGDQVAYYDQQLFINGEPVPTEEVGPYVVPGGQPVEGRMLEYTERLNGLEHAVVVNPDQRALEGEFVVPEGHYFAIGDNRNYSNDSRRWGYVPQENLVGHARMIWMNWNWQDGGIDWSRIGASIR